MGSLFKDSYLNLLFIIPLATKAGSEIKVNVQLGTKRDSRVSMDIQNEFNQINCANFYVDSTDQTHKSIA